MTAMRMVPFRSHCISSREKGVRCVLGDHEDTTIVPSRFFFFYVLCKQSLGLLSLHVIQHEICSLDHVSVVLLENVAEKLFILETHAAQQR
jgi:hypothetical protein